MNTRGEIPCLGRQRWSRSVVSGPPLGGVQTLTQGLGKPRVIEISLIRIRILNVNLPLDLRIHEYCYTPIRRLGSFLRNSYTQSPGTWLGWTCSSVHRPASPVSRSPELHGYCSSSTVLSTQIETYWSHWYGFLVARYPLTSPQINLIVCARLTNCLRTLFFKTYVSALFDRGFNFVCR